ncbi:hypothetical protein [Evansella tamaricis]|uniref:Uncharacterized protein n=1 Tax=Evansella tamaricis TaxID=2069301 RepID=A0ABS6JIT1_9BACI|nr:hypothetical protein [Evansella tamaricis]MBU9713295.1 hypothetical protein [Evansella tamaricis]
MKKGKLTSVQLEQKIIHLQSELSRHKKRILDYEENYHYRLLDELKQTNEKLSKRNQLLEGSYQSLHNEKNKLEGELNRLSENVKEKDLKITELEGLLKQKDQKVNPQKSVDFQQLTVMNESKKIQGTLEKMTDQQSFVHPNTDTKNKNDKEVLEEKEKNSLSPTDWFQRNIMEQSSKNKKNT